ncbi:MAG: hypothetical protein JSU72_02570 [Deltaproteobacteria bacterium]|nr:MAG: hypothetical protein JSU72_02570 [Deltaproteobacteria bacterium]
MQRKRKTSTISFRLENGLKERLQALADKQRRTLSSLIDRILQEFLDAQENGSPPGPVQEDRRHHLRKRVVLPARWKFRQGGKTVELDVLVKDISSGGAYTEYVSGNNLFFLKDIQVSPLALVVRMPGSPEPVELDSEPRRIHITRDHVGVGLSFRNMESGDFYFQQTN